MLRHLRRDPFVIATFFSLLALIGCYLLYNWGVEIEIRDLGEWFDFVWLGLVLAGLLTSRGGRERLEDRVFWKILTISFMIWLLAELAIEFAGESFYTVLFTLFDEILYLGFYLGIALAIARIPDGSDSSLTGEAEKRFMGIAGPVTLVTGLLVYLIVISLIMSPEEYIDGYPSLLLYTMLDFYIAIRFMRAMQSAGSERWKQQSGLFALAFYMWGLLDLMDAIMRARGAEFPVGILLDFFWFVPFLLVVAAVRLRNIPPSSMDVGRDRDVHQERLRKRSSFEASLVIIALILPFLHYLGYSMNLLDPALQSTREICIIFYMIVIALLELTGNRLRSALQEVHAQAEQAQKLESIGVLAGGVAHDFNNLLTVISGRSQLMLRKVPGGTPEESQLLEIKHATLRASGLIRKLLSFRPSDDLAPEILDLNTVIDGMKGLLEGLISDDHRLDISFDPRLGMVHADRALMEQIIMNLVVNARDALPEGGNIHIKTGNIDVKKARFTRPVSLDPGSYIELVVRDDGIGIDSRDMKRIFEPFFTTKPRSQGTGLGLSMVYGAVKKSQGEIAVESEPGKGATFAIYLPRVEGEMEPEISKESHDTDPVGGDELILVAEDDPAVRLFVEDTLSGNGYRVESAANGRIALEYLLAAGEEVDLVLTDVMMPELGGVELAEEIVKRFPGLPVLFMSGFTDDSPVHALRVAEGVRLLDKPFAPEILLRVIREVLSGND